MGQFALIAMAAVSAISTIAQGNQAKAGADFQARQMREMANREEAISQREAIERRREAAYESSRARAVAAASGAGADDVTVNQLIAGVETQGEYNALSALYEGRMKARDLRTDASVAKIEGRAARNQSRISAITDFGKTMYGMYGKGGTYAKGTT